MSEIDIEKIVNGLKRVHIITPGQEKPTWATQWTPGQAQDLFKQFSVYGHSGLLKLPEVEKAVEKIWTDAGKYKSAIRQAYRIADVNNDNFIDADEFPDFLAVFPYYVELNQKFIELNDGYSDRVYSKDFCKNFLAHDAASKLGKPELMNLFRLIDANESNYIIFDEFCAYIAQYGRPGKSKKLDLAITPVAQKSNGHPSPQPVNHGATVRRDRQNSANTKEAIENKSKLERNRHVHAFENIKAMLKKASIVVSDDQVRSTLNDWLSLIDKYYQSLTEVAALQAKNETILAENQKVRDANEILTQNNRNLEHKLVRAEEPTTTKFLATATSEAQAEIRKLKNERTDLQLMSKDLANRLESTTARADRLQKEIDDIKRLQILTRKQGETAK